MKLTSHIATIAAACLIAVSAAAQSGIRNPMTQAVLQVYEEELRENPTNYSVLLNRAEEYFRHDEFALALADINRALECIPAGETETVLHARMLRAGIYNQTQRPAQALEDLSAALLIAPESYAVLIQKANTEYTLEQYALAKSDYQRANRINPRGPQVYIGLAKVAVKENNMGVANEMLESAVNLDPNNAQTYLSRAEVRKAMNNHNGAVEDLILALSVDADNPRAINALVEYGNTNYSAVMAGLSNAITTAPRVGMYRYLRAGIAQSHYHYLAALQDYENIIANRIYNYHGIYASMAECQFALGRYDAALGNIDYALGMAQDPTAEYFALRSGILRALGRYDEAVNAAADATAADRNSCAALMELALAYTATGRYDDAITLLGEAAMNDADDPRFPLLRGWVLRNYMNDGQAAAQQFRIVAEMEHFMADNPRSLKGFALLLLDQRDDAMRWMSNILRNTPDPDGLIHYYGACFYSLAGENEKGLECTSTALDRGYANYFDWTERHEGYVTVASLRDDLRFLQMLNRHNNIFGIE